MKNQTEQSTITLWSFIKLFVTLVLGILFMSYLTGCKSAYQCPTYADTLSSVKIPGLVFLEPKSSHLAESGYTPFVFSDNDTVRYIAVNTTKTINGVSGDVVRRPPYYIFIRSTDLSLLAMRDTTGRWCYNNPLKSIEILIDELY